MRLPIDDWTFSCLIFVPIRYMPFHPGTRPEIKGVHSLRFRVKNRDISSNTYLSPGEQLTLKIILMITMTQEGKILFTSSVVISASKLVEFSPYFLLNIGSKKYQSESNLLQYLLSTSQISVPALNSD